MNWLALDIGGANLKLADGRRYAESHAFALWKHPDRLVAKLRAAIAEAPPCDHLAVTMTGELADCFETKDQGVQFILRAVNEVAAGRHTRVYLHDGSFVTPAVAAGRSRMAASSNWHALARFCGRFAPHGSALLIDVGSTTADFVPLRDGKLVCQGHTDSERLMAGELVYTGVERSPVCALVRRMPFQGTLCPVAQEVFATTRDIYLVLGDLPEGPDDLHTADGRPATRARAERRMGRMVSADDGQFSAEDARLSAQHVSEAQLRFLAERLQLVCRRLGEPPATVVVSGHGEFLARRMLSQMGWTGQLHSLQQRLGPGISRCAPAHALAVLAREQTEK